MFDQYGNSILRLAYSYLHNLSDAEDILQDVLIQYMKAQPVFQSDAHEKAWLLRVSANLSKNRIQYNKLRETNELEETLAAGEQEEGDNSGVYIDFSNVKEQDFNDITSYLKGGGRAVFFGVMEPGRH